MTVKNYGGGGSGGGLVITPHTSDGDTIEHWDLDGDLDASVNFAPNALDGNYFPIPVPGGTRMGVTTGEVDIGMLRTSGCAADIRTPGASALTVAMVLYTGPRWGGASNVPIFRCAPFDQGTDTEVNNTLYDVAWNGLTGALRIFWENGAGNNNTASHDLIYLPEKEWVHLVFTRNADGLGGRLYVNDTFVAYTQSNVSTGGANAEFCLGNSSTGATRVPMCFYSVIIKDIAASESEVAAMRAQVGLA